MNIINKAIIVHYKSKINDITKDCEQRIRHSEDEHRKILLERDKTSDRLLRKVRDSERRIYLKALHEKQDEIERLRKVIEDNKRRYLIVKEKEVGIIDISKDLGILLEVARKKNAEAIQYVEQAVSRALTYEDKQKAINNEMKVLEREI